MDGMLVIRKEKGYTSHDVVAKLRRILGMKKIGHTGTLDPQAEGVLPIVLGAGTKLAEFFTEKEKTYEAVLRLGMVTDTQDIFGTVLEEKKVEASEEEIRNAVSSFQGDCLQIPPMYSALKVDGKKLYELAREGIEVERKARPVAFYEIRILEIAIPKIRILVTCSRGTYIRTLCHDIGQSLGCGGCMEALTRTRSGSFTLEESHTLAEVEQAVSNGRIMELILPVEAVLSDFPTACTTKAGDRLLANGNPLTPELIGRIEGLQEDALPPKNELPDRGQFRMYAGNGAFVGLYEWRKNRMAFYPVKMFYPDRARNTKDKE